ncbi:MULTISPECIES: alpha/beta hydrolase [unclassified Actinobaculum]|uniref:alpha/beta hydrolase n=1 Tax=unclassified Actinobaculum TaxID=2609299 RepID=UPI000D5261EE|nr:MULTISPECIES: alpha/beta hydrolase [unclassified Actinobaculum]AWE42051.1 hypothetical protein DDD63_03935 [Actinobaculum sp. 313]RTE50600.1 hypothetical protein EKN07_00100 [Actinobaculum sp. 352]
MVTWAQIAKWKASSLDGFLDMLISARKRGMAVGDYISQTDVSTGWRGAGAEAAQDRLNQIEASCEYLLANIGDLIMATSTAQDGVGEVELALNEALSWAGYWNFSISESGEVIDPHPYDVGIHANPEARELADEHNAALENTRMAVDAAMSKTDEVDRTYQQALAKIASGEVSEVEALDDTPGVPDAPPENASTEQVAAWWNSLTEAERNAMFDKYYRRLGNLDGIDAATRDKANRRAFEEDYRVIEEELEELDKRFATFPDRRATGLNEEPMAPGDSEKMQRWSDLHHRKTDIEAIRNALDGANGDTQLLLYESRTDEPGHTMTHAAIAVGDVDTADNVTTYVPGMTTTVAKDIESMVGDMERLKQHSE